MPMKPITGVRTSPSKDRTSGKGLTGKQMLRRGLVLDLSVAFGSLILSLRSVSKPRWLLDREKRMKLMTETTGFHIPAVRKRDTFYAKLEDKRAEALGQV
ncbi:Cytochrome c oxidase subunit 7A [Elasticomyces elasticus]|nr:Cytochrome c oxidase subunit 7A [Elasticomyces elasticus]